MVFKGCKGCKVFSLSYGFSTFFLEKVCVYMAFFRLKHIVVLLEKFQLLKFVSSEKGLFYLKKSQIDVTLSQCFCFRIVLLFQNNVLNKNSSFSNEAMFDVRKVYIFTFRC